MVGWGWRVGGGVSRTDGKNDGRERTEMNEGKKKKRNP
jgi:hypothetical protein